MKDESEDIMSIYSNTAAKIYIPNAEQEFQTKCLTEGNGLIDRYFTQSKPKVASDPVSQPISNVSPTYVLSEAQQRNGLLGEATTAISKVISLYSNQRDREYLKEIREALEDMVE